jgi:hypothetical protein
MKNTILFLLIASIMAFWGCEQNPSAVNQNEAKIQEEIRAVIEDSLDLYFDALDDYSEDNLNSDDPSWLGGSAGLSKEGRSLLRYGRIAARPLERTIEVITDSDTTATAYIYTKMSGKFMVIKLQAGPDTLSFSRYQKPLIHEIERIVHLKKIYVNEGADYRWKVVDISFAVGQSDPDLIDIEEVTVMARGVDTLSITDPLAYFMGGTDHFILPRFTEVKLEVKVRNNTPNPVVYPEDTEATESVRLQYGRNLMGHFARQNFEWVKREGDVNIYEGTWMVRQFRGIHHMVIDVIDNGTILVNDNEAYPYVSKTWSAPYMVIPF